MNRTHSFLSVFLLISAVLFSKINPDSLKKLLTTNDPKKKINLYSELQGFYLYKDQDSAMKYCNLGLELSEKLNDLSSKAGFLVNLGNIYVEKNDYTKALDKYIDAEKLCKAANDVKGMINSVMNIGYVYEHQNLPKTAIMQYETALAVAKKIEDKQLEADCYGFLGACYFNLVDDTRALEYFDLCYKLNKELGNERKMIEAMNNQAVVYKDLGRLDEAIVKFFHLLDLSKRKSNYFDMCVAYHNLAVAYMDKKNTSLVLMYLDSSVTAAREDNNFENLLTIYTTFIELYSKEKNFEKAFEYYQLKFAVKDSMLQLNRDKQFIEMSTKYGSEKKEAENKLLKAEGEKQRTMTIAVSIGLLLMLVLAFFIFWGYRQKKKANQLLATQNTEIKEQKHIIEEKQKEILDSITYAKRLQEAILPPVSALNKYFDSIFIYYKPKDIVAGDFYWMEHKDDHTFIAAADCTGHGVPGALVSVVCSNALNRTVLEFNITDPGKILDKTRELVLETFSKSDKDVKDGMDISLLAVNNRTKELKWSGANNPLWYTQGGEMKEIVADKQSIGRTDDPKPFTTHVLSLEKDSSVFLFTDGYADQFGGPKGKKFKYKPLQSLLLQNINEEPLKQREKLKEAFNTWKGNLEQVDDVCVIGVKV